MTGTLPQIYLHFVWGTWDRHPFLREPVRSAVYRCIQSECRRMRMEVIAIGGIEDHVHLLVKMPASMAPSDFVKQVKGASSHLVNHTVEGGAAFRWQGGYGVFSVSPNRVDRVRDYVLRQEEHHRENRIAPGVEPSFAPAHHRRIR